MKIDIYAHWFPKKAAQALLAKAKPDSDPIDVEWARSMERSPAMNDLDIRFKFMDRHPDILHVLVYTVPPVEALVGPKDAADICKIMNDEMAELVVKYPDRFVAAVATLPMNDMDLALKECDRAITQLGMKGILLFTSVAGEALDSPRLRPLYEKMAGYDRPIWIHCTDWLPRDKRRAFLNWEHELTDAMGTLASSNWVFKDFPNLKFVIHHAGAMVPTYEQRVKWMNIGRNPNTHPNLRKFYVDTALYGNPAGLMCAYAFFGADHILYGTDAPLGVRPSGAVELTLCAIDQMDIPPAEKNKIYLENALNLLRLGL